MTLSLTIYLPTYVTYLCCSFRVHIKTCQLIIIQVSGNWKAIKNVEKLINAPGDVRSVVSLLQKHEIVISPNGECCCRGGDDNQR